MKKGNFRFINIPDGGNELKISVVEIFEPYYAIIGNSQTLLIKDLKKDWGKKATWGKYIK